VGIAEMSFQTPDCCAMQSTHENLVLGNILERVVVLATDVDVILPYPLNGR
jgi:hypothetical protein